MSKKLAAHDTERIDRIDAKLEALERERQRLVKAIATGGDPPSLVEDLRTRGARRAALDAERAAVRARGVLQASAASTLRDDLVELASSWRQVLADPTHARPIVSSLLQDASRSCRSK